MTDDSDRSPIQGDEKGIPNELEEQAREFLQQDTIRTAPRDEKRKFLEQKGLTSETIERLLQKSELDADQLRTVHDSTSLSAKTNATASLDAATPATMPTSSQSERATPSIPTEARRDVPPIITYPEFLLKSQKPPPLVTVERLVNAGYVLAGAYALTWAASKYIVQPMIKSLTEARHDLADTTLTALSTLNTKLEANVSHVPYVASAAVRKYEQEHGHEEYRDEDAESEISDPTELFHRDIATQTTPTLSRKSSHDELDAIRDQYADPTASQASRLSSLQATLSTLSASYSFTDDQTVSSDSSLRTTMKALQEQIDTIESAYNLLKSESSGYGYGGIYSSASNDASKKSTLSGKDSEAHKFKQEIRSLKGAFLSTRNFASVGRATAGAYTPR